MKTVITFGEIMLRLSPPGFERLFQSPVLSATFGGGERLGIYFAETGASQRAGNVIYDRAGSAIAGTNPGAFDWPRLLDGAAWFHVTGITPALGPEVAQATKDAVEAARAAGARVSLDLNYRRKLWTEREAQAVMLPLAAA